MLSSFTAHFFKIAICASFLIGFQSSAYTGAGSGGGGDPRCQNFYDLAFEISTDMVQLGQSAFGNPELIDVSLIRLVVMKPLNVTPGLNLPRPAWSDPASISTQLDIDQWEHHMSDSEKMRLVVHELMVLSGKEPDGVYSVSKIAAKILTDHGYFAALKFESVCKNSTGCLFNEDGSVTIKNPSRESFGYSAEKTDFDGICKSLGAGFTSAIAHEAQAYGGDSTYTLRVDSAGHFLSYYQSCKKKHDYDRATDGYGSSISQLLTWHSYKVCNTPMISFITCR